MKFKKRDSKYIDINWFISDDGLDALRVLEGHSDVKKVKNMRNKNTTDTTGLYGITDSCIKEVKLRAAEAGIELPKSMQDITSASQLNSSKKDVARQYAGYYAWVNYTKMDEMTDGAFDTYNQHQKDVLLTYLHNVDISKLSKGTEGSLIDAIKNHNEDMVIRTLFMNKDGSLLDYETKKAEGKRGIANRLMATMQWWYNPDAEVVHDESKKDTIYRDVYSKKGHLSNMLKANNILCEISKKKQNDLLRGFDNATIEEIQNNEQPQQQIAQKPIAEPKQGQDLTFMEKLGQAFVSSIKPFFGGKSSENNQVAQNGENILNSNNGEV